jgi:hypothetical protein
MSLDSEYDHESPYSSGIRKGRARPSVRVPNSDNKDLRATFHRNSDMCPTAKKLMKEHFTHINKKTGQRGSSGLPNNLRTALLYIDLYSGKYKDTTFQEYNDDLFLLYQKQVNEYTMRNGKTKTKQWFDYHRNTEVYVITPLMGGRVLKGTLVGYDEKDLWIRVC